MISIEDIAVRVKENKQKEEEYAAQIKRNYAEIASLVQILEGELSKDTDKLYKEIEHLFKLKQEVIERQKRDQRTILARLGAL